MRGRRGLGSALLAVTQLLALPASVHAAITCTLDPVHPQPGQSVVLQIDGDPLPHLTAGDFAADWQVLGQQRSRFSDAHGQVQQTLQFTLLPRHGAPLTLPAASGCAQRQVVWLTAAPDDRPVLSTRIVPARPMVGEPVLLQLVVRGGPGGVDWQDVDLIATNALLQPLPNPPAAGSEPGTQIWSWAVLPLRAGSLDLQFGPLRGHRFGEPLQFGVAMPSIDIRPLPQYWRADLPVGVLRVQLQPAPHRLQLDQQLLVHGEIDVAGLDADAVQALLERSMQSDHFSWQPPRLRRIGVDGVVQRWAFDWPLRARSNGPQQYPQLRLPLLDPQRGGPTLLTRGWGPVTVDDPRPRRMLVALLTLSALISGLVLLRLTWIALQRAWRRFRWLMLDHRGLESAWRSARPLRSARVWLEDQAAAGLPLLPRHQHWLEQLERHRYGSETASSRGNDRALG